MRKIENISSRERKQRRNQIIIGIVLILLMATSTIGFIISFDGANPNQENSIIYNGFQFFKSANGWVFETNYGTFETFNEPAITEDIEFNLDVNINDFLNKPLYYVFTEESLASRELKKTFQSISLRQTRACIEGYPCSDENAPIKTCEDNVILIISSEEIKAYKENNCIFIEGSAEEQLVLSDKLIYEILGVQ